MLKEQGVFRLKRKVLDGIDFSFADISYSIFVEINFRNCVFEESIAKDVRIVASNFKDTLFKRSNFSYASMNENIGADSGSFVNVRFEEANLQESFFCFPVIQDCVFENCNLSAVDFDGSRMRNCKFKGRVDSSWFGGYSLRANKSILGVFNRVNTSHYPNLMENVDFSEATLVGVSFRNKIDLSKCKFPDDESCLLVKNISTTFFKVKKEIAERWKGEDKRICIHMIDNVYYTKEYHHQQMTVIDKYILLEQFGERFANRFFEIIDKFNS